MESGSADLWKQALDCLSFEEQQTLAPHKSGAPDGCTRLILAQQIFHLVQAKLDENDAKRLSFTLRGRKGRKIFVRDSLRNVASWLKRFIAVGDQLVQYDPGHAALPWAALRFVLQFTINDTEKHACVVDGIERIAQNLTRFAFRERLYSASTSSAFTELRASLVRLYAVVLRYEAAAIAYFDRPKLVRTLHSGLTGPAQFPDMLDAISEAEDNVTRWTAALDSETQLQVDQGIQGLSLSLNDLKTSLDSLDIPVTGTSQQLEALTAFIDETEKTKILDWYSLLSPKCRHNMIYDKVLPETGKWLLQTPKFRDWLISGSSSLLWLHGGPGMGKSCLAAIIVNHLSAQKFHQAYFYCSRDVTGTSRNDVLASLARQIAISPDGDLANRARQRYKKEIGKGAGLRAASEMPRKELVLHVSELCCQQNSVIIIVDALDECDDPLGTLDALQEIIDQSLTPVKVFVTSRDILELEERQDHFACIVAETGLKSSNDIESFVENLADELILRRKLLRTITNWEIKNDLTQTIKTRVLIKSQGMFRFAEMLLLRVCKFHTRQRILEFLATPHGVLDDLYANALSSAGGEDTSPAEYSFVYAIISWLLWSNCTILSHELVLAASLYVEGDELSQDECTEELMKTLLPGFFATEQTNHGSVLRFAHLSVREFLENRLEFGKNKGHNCIAIICIRRLQLPRIMDSGSGQYLDKWWQHQFNIRNHAKEIAPHPMTLYWYANSFMPLHCKESTTNGDDWNQDLSETFNRWLSTSAERRRKILDWWTWLVEERHIIWACRSRFNWSLLGHKANTANLFFLIKCLCGHVSAVRETLRDQNLSSTLLETATRIAAKTGNWPLTKVLVQVSVSIYDPTCTELFAMIVQNDAGEEQLSWLLKNAHPNILDPSNWGWSFGAFTYDMMAILLNFPGVKPVLNEQVFDLVCVRLDGFRGTTLTDAVFSAWLDFCPLKYATKSILTAAASATAEISTLVDSRPGPKSAKNFQRVLELPASHECYTKFLLKRAALCGNPAVLKALLDHEKSQNIDITLELLLKIIDEGYAIDLSKILKLLLVRFTGDTKQLLISLAERHNATAVLTLLSKQSPPREKVRVAACHNLYHGPVILQRLSDQEIDMRLLYVWTCTLSPHEKSNEQFEAANFIIVEECSITEEILLSLLYRAQNTVVALLFDTIVLPDVVSERVLLVALEKIDNHMMAVNFTQKCRNLPPITPRLVAMANNKSCCLDLFNVALRDGLSAKNVTTEVIVALAANYDFGHELLRLLEQVVGSIDLTVLARDLVAIARCSPDFLRMLFSRVRIPAPDLQKLFDLVAAFGHSESLIWLQSEFALEPQLSTLLQSFRARHGQMPRQMILHIMRHLDVSDWDDDMLEKIFSCTPELWTTFQMTLKASEDFSLTEKCLLGILSNKTASLLSVDYDFFSNNERERLFFIHDEVNDIVWDAVSRSIDVRVTLAVLEAAAHFHSSTFNVLLEAMSYNATSPGLDETCTISAIAETAARAGQSEILVSLKMWKSEAVSESHEDVCELVRVCESKSLEAAAALSELLRKGTPCDLPDRDGRTPLHRVSCPGNQLRQDKLIWSPMFKFIPDQAEIIELLVNAGADTETRDKDRQWTSLMWASWAFQFVAVDALLDAGADVRATNEAGETAASLAGEMGHLSLAARLRGLMESDTKGKKPVLAAASHNPDSPTQQLTSDCNDEV